MKWIANISRVLVGVLFIISGLIKANDPLGFAYKLHDYYEVFAEYAFLKLFSGPFFINTALETSIFICVLEVLLGIALLVGFRPRFIGWVYLVMIIGFTFLTGFSAITGKVTDCGCFGDAIKLTPWQSFYKDLILLFFIGWIVAGYKHIKPLFRKASVNNLSMLAGTAFSVIFTLYAYNHLPYIDFRPYAAGNDICELRTLPPDARQWIYESSFVYKNKQTGEEQQFSLENLPTGDDWEFVDQVSTLVQEGDLPTIQNFELKDEEGNEIADYFLEEPGYKFLLVCYNIEKTNTSSFSRINEVQQYMEAKGIPFYGVSASGSQQVELFRHDQQTAFPFYSGDETELKTIVRSNPGLVLMNGCKVVRKWHWRDIPAPKVLESNVMK